MSNRLTQAVLRSVGLARAEARRLNHGWLGTEHVLVALSLSPNTGAAKVFERLGVSSEQLRSGLEQISGSTPGPRTVALAPTPRLRGCLKKADRAASDFGRATISTALLLLAILSDQDSAASTILSVLEVERSLALGTVLDVAREPAPEEEKLLDEHVSNRYVNGLAPLPAIKLVEPPLFACPRGHGPMDKLRCDDVEVGVCAQCLGTFVPAGQLEKLAKLSRWHSLDEVFSPV